MALDKQKILNELGNVVNQLQSADCGCMGKLFSSSGQPNQMNNMQNCCGHGYNSPSAGEPCAGAQHCMGYCNPPKLYADTYSYLNHNLMQPVVQEVYDDLKSINPNNTVMNNPMGAQIGLAAGNNPNAGNMGQNSTSCGHAHVPHVHFGNPAMTSPNHPGTGQEFALMGQGMSQGGQDISHMEQGLHQVAQGHVGNEMDNAGHGMSYMGQVGHQQGMGHGMGQMEQGMGQMNQAMERSGGRMTEMGGMGRQIVNMMTGSQRSNTRNQGQAANNSPPGAMQQSPEMGQMVDVNHGQYNSVQMQNNADYMQMNNMQQGNPSMHTTQYVSQPNIFPGATGNAQSNEIPGNMKSTNHGSGHMRNMHAPDMNNPNPYGKHSAGIAKFNEMFPGVMKEDLGFDPMAIAIQMNPANQQKAAMDTMEKLMMNNPKGMGKVVDNNGILSSQLQPVVNATNAASASLAQPNQSLIHEAPSQHISDNVQQQQRGVTMHGNQAPQQVYSITGAPSIHQQELQQQEYLQLDQTQVHPPTHKHITEPNAGKDIISSPLPTVYEGYPNTRPPQRPVTQPNIYKDPIFPADTSRNLLQSHHFSHVQKPPRYFDYNTLGQPVERHYQYSNSPGKYSNVKETISKTALVGDRPVGRTPSRTQQQNIYNQYKGSHSYTQQNIKQNAHGMSYSEPHVNIPITQNQRYIERVGGDTAANNQVTPINVKLESDNPTMDQVGDVPASYKFPNSSAQKAAEKHVKLRNGLQDQIFSTSPTSAKWSFHGNTPAPYSVGYRFRARS